MANLSVALVTAQSLLNDSAKKLWTDALLIPFAQEAHRELQVALAEAGVAYIRKWTAAIAVAANATSLNLPADLIEPIDLQERVAGGTEADWVDVTQSDPLPSLAKGTTLGFWNWYNYSVVFIGATENREVRVFHKALITVPAAAGDSIGYTWGELYIGPRTASLAAGSIGNNTFSDKYRDEAVAKLEKVIGSNRDKHTPLVRP